MCRSQGDRAAPAVWRRLGLLADNFSASAPLQSSSSASLPARAKSGYCIVSILAQHAGNDILGVVSNQALTSHRIRNHRFRLATWCQLLTDVVWLCRPTGGAELCR